MPRYKLTIAYDGTEFHGWQMQHPPDPASDPALGEARPRVALRTVQEEVQRAVREIVREPVIVQGASRTDAGVHAKGQVAAFTCSGDEPIGVGKVYGMPSDVAEALGLPGVERIPEATPRSHGGWPVRRGVDRLVRALNGRLPDDVLVLGAEPVESSFEPTMGVASKCYTYTIHASRDRTLFDRRYVQHVWQPLNVLAMNDAAAMIVGEHDFTSFAATGHGRLTTVRTVHSCRVYEVGSLADSVLDADSGVIANGVAPGSAGVGVGDAQRVVIEVSGSGFLWNMVRIIAGTLVEVGQGRRRAKEIPEILASRDRRRAGVTLPASGLCLEWIRYVSDEEGIMG